MSAMEDLTPHTDATPDLTEKVIGYREWDLDGAELHPPLVGGARWRSTAVRLAGFGDQFLPYAPPWTPGVNVARCLHRSHAAPGKHCLCGLHAHHSLDAIRSARYHLPGGAFGAVAASGRVEVYGLGFRAERAEIVALAWGKHASRAARKATKRAAARYGVPAVPVRKLPEIAAEHGSSVPASLLPEGAEGIQAAALAPGQRTRLARALWGILATLNGACAVTDFGIFALGAHQASTLIGGLVNAGLSVWFGRQATS